MRKVVAAFVAAAVGAGLAVALITSGSGAASAWSCVVTGEQGGTHNYTVQADDQAGALAACKSAWVASATFKVSGGTTTTTTSSTSSSTTTSSTTTVPPGAGYPSLGGPFAFDGDFDAGCGLTSGQGAWNRIIGGPGGDHPGTISIVRSPVGEGVCAAEASIPAAGTVSDHTGRAALQAPSRAMPATYTWEALYYLPSGSHGVDHGALNQTKQGGSGGGCANGGLYVDNSTNRLSFNTVASCSSGSIKHAFGPAAAPRDHWFAVKVTEAFGNAGHVTLWLDGDGPGVGGYVQQLSFAADTQSGDSLKFDQGIYGDLQPAETHDFIDGFHVAN